MRQVQNIEIFKILCSNFVLQKFTENFTQKAEKSQKPEI